MPTKAPKRGVQKPYTFAKLKDDLLGVYDPASPDNSLRGLAKKLGVNHAVIQRILNGIEPKTALIRKRLNLVPLGQGELCAIHGKVCSKQCRESKPRKPRKPPAFPNRNQATAVRLLGGLMGKQIKETNAN